MYMKKYSAILLLVLSIAACSPKTNPKIDALAAQNKILELSKDLNDYNLNLEKAKFEISQITGDVKNANSDAVNSAQNANGAAAAMNGNPGNSKDANKAGNYADDAAHDAKKANKLNSKLSKLNREVQYLQKKIDKTNFKLSKLKARVEFVPNQ
jgi:chromosome segregation ATPase